MIEYITDKNGLIALIISHNFKKPGVHFVTTDGLAQQLAYICHPKGKKIEAHCHVPIERKVIYTHEVLVIKKGKIRVDLYNDQQQFISSHILESGSAILFASGGHGFKVLEEVEMIEVKQGPYIKDQDKRIFTGVSK